MNFKRFKIQVTRRFQCLKDRVQLSVLNFLVKCGVIFIHKKYSVTPGNPNPEVIPCSPYISERMRFDISFVIREEIIEDEHWYYTKKGKRLLTLSDNCKVETFIEYRAHLKSFECWFSPSKKILVQNRHPIQRVQFAGPHPLPFMEVETREVHFYKAETFKFVYKCSECSQPIPDLVEYSYRELCSQLEGKAEEINYLLTGVMIEEVI